MPTTSPESPKSLPVERYAVGKPLNPAALTPAAIARSTEGYNTPADTVALWEGRAYMPSLERIAMELGGAKVEAMMKLYLIRLNAVTNASRPLTEDAIEAMVPLIIDHITNELDTTITLADLRIVFDRAMKGHYGKTYGGFGCQDICAWFDQYDREKMALIDQVEQRRKDAELYGFGRSSESRGNTEIAKMRDAMHKYQLEKMKQDADRER